ncbi:MAG: hypothetical protein MHM6MM_005750 [Cercozoa sp. M6MM]
MLDSVMKLRLQREISLFALLFACFVVLPSLLVVWLSSRSEFVLDEDIVIEIPRLEDSCSVHCNNAILEAVHHTGMFNDSKTFVDLPLRKSPQDVLRAFEQLPHEPSNEEVVGFVEDNFYLDTSESVELLPAAPPGFTALPPTAFVAAIRDVRYQRFAEELHSLWRTLSRKVSPQVREMPSRFSLLPTKHAFITVPGERFRELFYWDTTWIIRGLIRSGLVEAARQLVENLADFVDRFDYVPNGARTYLSNRSQPPLLSEMAKLVYDALDETQQKREFVTAVFPQLVKEMQFWYASDANGGRTIDVNGHKMQHYGRIRGTFDPRPESHAEDVETALDSDNKERVYMHLQAGAESGWDFSGRWNTDLTDLATIETADVVPVELQVFLCRSEQVLAEFSQIVAPAQTSFWRRKRKERVSAVETMFNGAFWQDIRADGKRIDRPASIASFLPLWHGCHSENLDPDRVLDELLSSRLVQEAGVATTLFHNTETGQQWDFPNAWAPLQHLLVEAALQIDTPKSRQFALALASRWVRSNHVAFKRDGQMHEKMDATRLGQHGVGGEYEAQHGFGWSNGVVLDLLGMFGHELTSQGELPAWPQAEMSHL